MISSKAYLLFGASANFIISYFQYEIKVFKTDIIIIKKKKKIEEPENICYMVYYFSSSDGCFQISSYF